jgi:hypothetical protein
VSEATPITFVGDAVDPRALELLLPFIATAIEDQPDPAGVLLAAEMFGVSITVADGDPLRIVAAVADNNANPHPVCDVLAELVGLHRVDGTVMFW